MTKGKIPQQKKKINPKYRSGFEKQTAQLLQKKKILFEYESDNIDYVIEHKYKTDFKILKKDGTPMFIETKGYMDSQSRRKYVAVKKYNPNIDLRFIFQNSKNKIRKGSKTSYGDWATKQGFKWSEKTIPQDWLRE
jgi:hypothetical protein